MVFTHRDVRSIDAIASGDLSRSFHARVLFLMRAILFVHTYEIFCGWRHFLKKKFFWYVYGDILGLDSVL